MAFFNYSTMQMTAKIVYYGPGLGGKTTNLEFIHKHTTDDSRGEMVSLQTQSDRTLFFDLLPMEVGTIAGFKTKIQLYTVPGQVFYNTTRKLVLKGVDGVVFVADSQKPMLQANRESLLNLEDNLATLGRTTETTPLVLQYNKMDLDETFSSDELNAQLNEGNWPHYEASALFGDGVFETLQGITRLTLLSLKKQLETSSGVGPARPKLSPPPTVPKPKEVEPEIAASETAEPESEKGEEEPVAATEAEEAAAAQESPLSAGLPGPDLETVPITAEEVAKILDELPSPEPETERKPEPELAAAPEPAEIDEVAGPEPIEEIAAGNGQPAGARLEVELGTPELARSRRVLIDLRFHDERDKIVHEVRDLVWDFGSADEIEELLVRLSISARAEE